MTSNGTKKPKERLNMKQYWKMKEFGWVWCELYILWRTIIRSIPFHFIPWLEKEYGFDTGTQKNERWYFFYTPSSLCLLRQLEFQPNWVANPQNMKCCDFWIVQNSSLIFVSFIHSSWAKQKLYTRKIAYCKEASFPLQILLHSKKVRYAFVTIMTIRKLSSLRNLWRYAWKQSKENRFPHSRKFRLFPYSQSS